MHRRISRAVVDKGVVVEAGNIKHAVFRGKQIIPRSFQGVQINRCANDGGAQIGTNQRAVPQALIALRVSRAVINKAFRRLNAGQRGKFAINRRRVKGAAVHCQSIASGVARGSVSFIKGDCAVVKRGVCAVRIGIDHKSRRAVVSLAVDGDKPCGGRGNLRGKIGKYKIITDGNIYGVDIS